MVDTAHIQEVATFLSTGSVTGVIFLLLAIIGGFLWERNRLVRKTDDLTEKFLQSKTEYAQSIQDMIHIYHQGNLTLVQTLVEIKGVLATIQQNRR